MTLRTNIPYYDGENRKFTVTDINGDMATIFRRHMVFENYGLTTLPVDEVESMKAEGTRRTYRVEDECRTIIAADPEAVRYITPENEVDLIEVSRSDWQDWLSGKG